MRRIAPVLLLLLLLHLAIACDAGGGTSPLRSPAPSAAPAPTAPASASPRPEVTLVAAGDVMLGRTIGEGIARHGPEWPLAPVAGVLRSADIAFVNLESPLTARGVPADKDFVFRGPPAGALGLARAGVDIVSLANNHVLDYGLEGLTDTMQALSEAGVSYAGAGADEAAARSAAIIERNGLRVAFLAYVNTPPDSVSGFDASSTRATPDRAGVAWLLPETVAADVTAARQRADLVIVSMHTGTEYEDSPTELQEAAAHAAIDAGATLVLGGHPHVLQGIERYKGGLIIYSLGNFVFDFDNVDYAHPGLPSALSAMLRVRMTAAGVLDCEIVPVAIAKADGRPHLAGAAEAPAVLERVSRLSDGSCGAH